MEWLPNPADGTMVCLGFDGSDVEDWSALRAETVDGFQFTPRYGPDNRPTIWNPADWGGETPRHEVHAAVDELWRRYDVRLFYCDPFGWASEVGDWFAKYGDKQVLEWRTNRPRLMFEEIRRFESDLASGRIAHDGCPLTAMAMSNAVRAARPNDTYILNKPAGQVHRKIDPAIASILAHTAAADAHEQGWAKVEVEYAYVW